MIIDIFYILIYPGFLFLCILSLFVEFIDRKLYARFQNRQGPYWFQPFADFIKLSSKETIIPETANALIFSAMPTLALVASILPIFYIPLTSTNALYSFEGDLIAILYILTIPTVSFFLGGYFSGSLYSAHGAMRTLIQLFGYEVPLFLGLLSPAILASSWSLTNITNFYYQKPYLIIFNLVGLIVALIASIGKLEKVPFDTPEAETEIVGGTFTEYGGRYLAFFRLAIDIEQVIVASIISAIYLPLYTGSFIVNLVLYLLKVFLVTFFIALIRSLFARLRIDQMVNFCWKYLAPLGLLNVIILIIVKYFLIK